MKIRVIFTIDSPARNPKRILEKAQGKFINLITCNEDLVYHGPKNLIPAYYGSKTCHRTMNNSLLPFVFTEGICDVGLIQMPLNYQVL